MKHLTRIPASIEASPRHVLDGKLTPSLLPAGTRVYITDVGVDPLGDYVRAAKITNEHGYVAVPHVPVRRIESEAALRDRLDRLTGEAGVRDVLVIAGEADRTMGPYERVAPSPAHRVCSIARKDHGDRRRRVIPEGNVAYRNVDPNGVLHAKAAACRTTSDATFRIVTQFGFDGEGFVRWSRAVADSGVDLPVHLGVAGPAKITTLLKYAAMCGVGNSMNFFRKRTSAIAALATKHSPEDVVGPIERAWAADDHSRIAGMHVFPFGGLAASAEWLHDRGSFAPHSPALVAAQ